MAKKSTEKKSAAKKGPRQNPLPGMENRKIAALQDAALSYAEIRDQRMELGRQESELKAQLLKLMHKYKKESYRFGSVAIDLVREEETVKVKIKSESEPADEPETAPDSEEATAPDFDDEDEEGDLDPGDLDPDNELG